MLQQAVVEEKTTTAADGTVTIEKTITQPDGTVTKTTTTTTLDATAALATVTDIESQKNEAVPSVTATTAPANVAAELTESTADYGSIRGLSTGAASCLIAGIASFAIGWIFLPLWWICFVLQIVVVVLVSVPLCTTRNLGDGPVKSKLVGCCVVNSIGLIFAILFMFVAWFLVFGYIICVIIGLVQSIQLNKMVGGGFCGGRN